MNSRKLFALGAFAVLGLGVLSAPSVFAAQVVGSVTGRDGDVKEKVALTAQVNSVSGSHITFTDVETGKEYTTSFGPARESNYTVGQQVEVVGVETDGSKNGNNHNFQVMELDGEVVRENFEGRPLWAGSHNKAGAGNANGKMNRGESKGSTFIDENGDGVCDNSIN